MSCRFQMLREVVGLLEKDGVQTWVFGGWAEELRGLTAPRLHADLDLLYPAEDFATVDRLIAARELEEITAKHFAHKRALRIDGVVVEIFLMTHGDHGWHTMFWGRARHDWPVDALSRLEGQRVVGAAALRSYRCAYQRLRERRPVSTAGRPLR